MQHRTRPHKAFNLSIRTGTVPTAWKTSFVVPIPKSKTLQTHLTFNLSPYTVNMLQDVQTPYILNFDIPP